MLIPRARADISLDALSPLLMASARCDWQREYPTYHRNWWLNWWMFKADVSGRRRGIDADRTFRKTGKTRIDVASLILQCVLRPTVTLPIPNGRLVVANLYIDAAWVSPLYTKDILDDTRSGVWCLNSSQSFISYGIVTLHALTSDSSPANLSVLMKCPWKSELSFSGERRRSQTYGIRPRWRTISCIRLSFCFLRPCSEIPKYVP